MKTSIIIPTYNEAENIELLLHNIFAQHIDDLSVVIVDDNSPDKTADIIKKLQQTYPIHLIERQEKSGLGSAYIAGFRYALSKQAQYIFEMDADFSHDPADIPRLLDAVKHSDLVIGSRKINGGQIIGWNFIRIIMSNGAMWFSRILLNFTVQDVTAGFRCFRSQVLNIIDLDSITSNGYAFQEELLLKTQEHGFTIVEIPVIFRDRKNGQSKLGITDIIEFFITIVTLRLKRNSTKS